VLNGLTYLHSIKGLGRLRLARSVNGFLNERFTLTTRRSCVWSNPLQVPIRRHMFPQSQVLVFFSLLFVYWFPRSEFVTTRCAPLELWDARTMESPARCCIISCFNCNTLSYFQDTSTKRSTLRYPPTLFSSCQF
jgi:hypothetical protein